PSSRLFLIAADLCAKYSAAGLRRRKNSPPARSAKLTILNRSSCSSFFPSPASSGPPAKPAASAREKVAACKGFEGVATHTRQQLRTSAPSSRSLKQLMPAASRVREALR